VYDRGADLGNPQCGDGIEREPGNGSRGLIAAQPIQTCGEANKAARILAVLPVSR
jgi:hypothetical protein